VNAFLVGGLVKGWAMKGPAEPREAGSSNRVGGNRLQRHLLDRDSPFIGESSLPGEGSGIMAQTQKKFLEAQSGLRPLGNLAVAAA
jgi:hypothetical protein